MIILNEMNASHTELFKAYRKTLSSCDEWNNLVSAKKFRVLYPIRIDMQPWCDEIMARAESDLGSYCGHWDQIDYDLLQKIFDRAEQYIRLSLFL